MIASRSSWNLEKHLYRPVAELLERLGLEVWPEATIRVGTDATLTADHVAWRWAGDVIDTLAVEVKPGSGEDGFKQALSYSAGFDHVYLGAEAALGAGGPLTEFLDREGVGFIEIDRVDQQAHVAHEPGDNHHVVPEFRDENIGRIRVRHLFTEDMLGEPVRHGDERFGTTWAVAGDMSRWQLCAQVTTGSPASMLMLLAESKDVGDRVVKRFDAAALASLVKQTGPGARLQMRRREHKGFRPKYSEVLGTWQPSDGVPALAEVLDRARALSGPRVAPHFEIHTELWPHGMRLTEKAARHELRARLAGLREIQHELNGRK
jgi:hypothetical protein